MKAHHPNSLCLPAVEELQHYLSTQNEWEHNFGISDGQTGSVIGKMFGVLVVETPQKNIEHLWAFSGKLADKNLFSRFVPPVFDTLAENSFLSAGMEVLTQMGEEISTAPLEAIPRLKAARKKYSIALQNQLFQQYHFLNQVGEEKSLIAIFKEAGYKNPPAGAGECAAPKLLQYAFQHQLKPIALTEFWWGQSPKSATWKHGHFYAPCKEKCEPILKHMLDGIYGI